MVSSPLLEFISTTSREEGAPLPYPLWHLRDIPSLLSHIWTELWTSLGPADHVLSLDDYHGRNQLGQRIKLYLHQQPNPDQGSGPSSPIPIQHSISLIPVPDQHRTHPKTLPPSCLLPRGRNTELPLERPRGWHQKKQ
uniref:Uncharacterized protein n=1 Tax=Knipowitschia caucasica TaxID=637954 RepID=A0AAV2KV88_KNICA